MDNNVVKDMPQLVIALDSDNDKAQYVYISNAKEDTEYYCPCCKGKIKPRAYKDDKTYMVQPHYYHISGGCTEESYVHYICKMFLTKKNCKFIVKDKEYTVDNIDVEKTYHTKFGNYRPDVTILTTEGKTIFAEIAYSNKKNQEYVPKWDELENDVIEIDARYFVNLVMENKVPDFKLIYSNGECFIKNYVSKDYEKIISQRKSELKRQDILNYKIRWEKLDYLWIYMQQYKASKFEKSHDELVESFKNLDFEDMDFVITVIKKMKCIDIYEELKDIIKQEFFKKIKEYNLAPYTDVVFNQESQRVMYIGFEIYRIKNCVWYDSYCYNKHFDYYGLELFNNFLYSYNKSRNIHYFDLELPLIGFIKSSNGYKMLSDAYCKFYLQERIAVYCGEYNYKYNCLNYMNCDESWNYLIDKSDLLIKKEGYELLCNKRTLTKSQHLDKKIKFKNEYDIYLLTNFISKRINNCKNNYWSFRISSISLNTFSVILEFYVRSVFMYRECHVNFDIEVNKYQFYEKIKLEMRKLYNKY